MLNFPSKFLVFCLIAIAFVSVVDGNCKDDITQQLKWICGGGRNSLREPSNLKLIVLHNNDMHARFDQTGELSDVCRQSDAENNNCFGGFARVANVVRNFRKRAKAGEIPSVLYLNAGDVYTGTPLFAMHKENISAEFMNVLKPDAMALGNHEFDEGTENLASFLKAINFPVVAANLNTSKAPDMDVDSLKPSIVLQVDGQKIGIVGYVTRLTKITTPENNVEFTDEVEAVNKATSRLKAEGVNIIIALGHSGIVRDKEVAAQCPHLDLIVGGHSHTFLFNGTQPSSEKIEGNYPTFVTQPSGKRVPIVQAYAFTKYLGILQLEFDKHGNLVEIDGTPILLDSSIEQEVDVLKLLEKYRPGISELEKEVVGSTSVFINGSCRQNECNFGNFIVDSMVEWHSLNNNADVSIALLTSGDIRTSIDNQANYGLITKNDVATAFPFRNKLSVVEVSGKALIKAFEHSASRSYEVTQPGEFLQVSGVRIVFDLKKPSGQRVANLKVLCTQCQTAEYQEVDELKMYKVLLGDYLANGGDGFEMFKRKTVRTFETLIVDVLLEYLKKNSPIVPALEKRISYV